MKILVTGSSGQLGSYICEALSGRHEIVGLDIMPPVVEGIQHIDGSILSRSDVASAIAGVDAVAHCAAQVSVEKSMEDPFTDAQTNIVGTLNLLQGSLGGAVGRFVYISSAAVLGNPQYLPIDESHPVRPTSNYGASKLAGERYALAYAHSKGLETVAIRPFNFYSTRSDPSSPYSGVISKFICRVKEDEPPIIEGDGLQTRDFVHAKDVAGLVSTVLEWDRRLPGEVFNCGSGEPSSVIDLARLVIRLSGKAIEPEFTSPRIGDIRDSLADMSKTRSTFGFHPRISLREGLSEMLG